MKNMAQEKAMLKLRDMAVGYGQKQVLNQISCQIKSGQFVSLLGPNGSGKTTLLRTLARLLDPMEGGADINEQDLFSLPQKELAKIQAVVLTERLAPELLTVYEMVSLGRHPHTGFMGKLDLSDHKAIEDALVLVQASHLASRYFTQLSDGEKQKILIARALAQNPKLVILDEPTVHLDLKHRLEVMTILRKLSKEKGLTVLASLHDVDIAVRISDQVGLVKNGRILAWGTPETVLDEASLLELYDLDCVSFSRELGLIEFKTENNGEKIFVAAGGGSGARVYRLFAKNGFSISSGVLQENDIDWHVGDSLGVGLVGVKAFAPIDDLSMEKAFEMAEKASWVIDAGFPVVEQNQPNLSMLQKVLEQGGRVLSLREQTNNFLSQSHGELIYCQKESDLMNYLQ